MVAFIGGLFHHKVEHYTELAEKLHEEYGDRIRVKIVFNAPWDRRNAEQAVHQWLDTNGDGKLSEAEEKRAARIILYGHSWGGPAELAFARRLQRENIPILLTVQIDSISKPGLPVGSVPANVAQAINFYQPRGILHGHPEIVAADPSRTKILGNIEIPFDPQAARSCTDYPKVLRVINKYHIAIECNPRVWSQIETLINANFFSPATPDQQGKGYPAAE